MKYKIVTMSNLIENTSMLEKLKKFKITKKVITEKGYLGKEFTYNEFYIEIRTVKQLEEIQKLTDSAINLYRRTLEIEDDVYSCVGGNFQRREYGK